MNRSLFEVFVLIFMGVIIELEGRMAFWAPKELKEADWAICEPRPPKLDSEFDVAIRELATS